MTMKNILKNMKNSVSALSKSGSSRKISTLRRKLSTPRLQRKFPSPKLIKRLQNSTSNFFKKTETPDFEAEDLHGFSEAKIDHNISESCADFDVHFNGENQYEKVMERARKASELRRQRIKAFNAKHITPPVILPESK